MLSSAPTACSDTTHAADSISPSLNFFFHDLDQYADPVVDPQATQLIVRGFSPGVRAALDAVSF
jgi:hypothetical protein